MYGSDWNWCDAVGAIAAVITPILGSGFVIQWFQHKRVEAIRSEESRNMQSDAGANVDIDDPLREFWTLVQRNVPELKGRSIPTRRFWSISCRKGVRLVYVISGSDARVELYIDNGDEEWNLRFYNKLRSRKTEVDQCIARQIHETVVWFDRPNSRAKGVGVVYDTSGLPNRGQWDAIVQFYNRASPVLRTMIETFDQ